MLKTLLQMLSGGPKARVRIIIRGALAVDDIMTIHQMIRAWKLPGWMQAVPGSHLTVEVEGAERTIREAVNNLSQSRHLFHGDRIEVSWHPFRGDLDDFRCAA